MAMRYTDQTYVKDMIRNINTDLSDDQIRRHIEISEGFIDLIMKAKSPDDFTFSESKPEHKAIRRAATAAAALAVAFASPISNTTLEDMQNATNGVYDIYKENLEILKDQDFINRIKRI